MRVYSVDKRGFTRTGHANGEYHYRLFSVSLPFRSHRRSRQDVVYYLIFFQSTPQVRAFQKRTLGAYKPFRQGRLAHSLPPPSSPSTSANQNGRGRFTLHKRRRRRLWSKRKGPDSCQRPRTWIEEQALAPCKWLGQRTMGARRTQRGRSWTREGPWKSDRSILTGEVTPVGRSCCRRGSRERDRRRGGAGGRRRTGTGRYPGRTG